MRNVFKVVLLAAGVAGFTNAKAQGVLDGVYVKEHIPTKKVIYSIRLFHLVIVGHYGIFYVII
jgi:hypothetical protein